MEYWFICLKIYISVERSHYKRKFRNYYQCWVLVTFRKPQKLIPNKKNHSLKGFTLLLVQTQMILVLTCFSTVQPFHSCLHIKLTAATVF